MSIAKQNQWFSGYFRPKLRKTMTKRRIAETNDFGGILDRLRNDPEYGGTCPDCQSEFRLCDAQLFSLSEELPAAALTRIAQLKADLKDRRAELALAKERMTSRAAVTTESVHIGKVCERIAPSLPGFAFNTSDCRALWEPIDYVAFPGLGTTGVVERIVFLEVKTGSSRLNGMQRAIAGAIQTGKVSLTTVPGVEVGHEY
jgi:predicted Holliday junction resolvase-like endonuclease